MLYCTPSSCTPSHQARNQGCHPCSTCISGKWDHTGCTCTVWYCASKGIWWQSRDWTSTWWWVVVLDIYLVARSSEGSCTYLGLTVGQVRVIFSLPQEYRWFEHSLAYVEWFTSFSAPVPDLGMYQVSRSTHSHCCHASIISVTQIVHLILKFGRVMNITWSVENVLEACKTFYVNPYVCHLDFLLLHYLSTWLFWCNFTTVLCMHHS